MPCFRLEPAADRLWQSLPTGKFRNTHAHTVPVGHAMCASPCLSSVSLVLVPGLQDGQCEEAQRWPVSRHSLSQIGDGIRCMDKPRLRFCTCAPNWQLSWTAWQCSHCGSTVVAGAAQRTLLVRTASGCVPCPGRLTTKRCLCRAAQLQQGASGEQQFQEPLQL